MGTGSGVVSEFHDHPIHRRPREQGGSPLGLDATPGDVEGSTSVRQRGVIGRVEIDDRPPITPSSFERRSRPARAISSGTKTAVIRAPFLTSLP